MTETKKILHIALPAMAENFLQFLMGMIDSYLIAHLGLIAISGVSVANNIITIYQALFIALGAATSALLARFIGQKQTNRLSVSATESIQLTVMVSLLLGLLSIFGGRFLLSLLGTEAAVAEAGGLYLSVVGGSVVLLGLMTTLGAILRVAGKSRTPMFVSLLSNVLNAFFSAVAVFVFQSGIVGVALGTVLARVVACWILWKQLPFRLNAPSWKMNKDLLRLALPAAGERLMMRAGDVVIIALIVSLGTAVVAGNAIGETLTQFNYMPGMGIATALVVLVAQAQGEGDIKQVRRLGKAGFLLSLVTMLLISLFVFLFANPLIALYTQDQTAIESSLVVIVSSLLGTPMTAGTLVYTAVWQGNGNAQLPFYATTIGMWVIRIGVGYCIITFLECGLAGVWLATLLDNLCRWIFLYVMFRRNSRKILAPH
ncbi:MATE family efflux transporter [Streptococcus ovis]|uniref:MATE family efflux transporter n=1 Tax=Streptococcus ovis TaxID=82806 RepID=UPI00036BA635|nr:MATE family efflux transporter [Streptococcus ovis]